MKTTTCNQLGGACDVEFHADYFEEIKNMSMQHGKEMFKKGDSAHLKAMEKMRGLMHEPNAMEVWMEGKKKEFDALAED
ncbi:MAG: hypothetical protein ACJA01_003322 [Saprospiraceae bacterium]|jgi:hypothetical protein